MFLFGLMVVKRKWIPVFQINIKEYTFSEDNITGLWEGPLLHANDDLSLPSLSRIKVAKSYIHIPIIDVIKVQ